MNRFIIGPIGVLSLVAALFAVGCAVDQTDGGDERTEHSDDSESVASGSDAQEIRLGGRPMFEHRTKKPASDVCVGCGPVPDPWVNGPVPDPWTSSSSSSSSGGSNGGSSNGGSGNSSSGKP
jgi:hypothetical protein